MSPVGTDAVVKCLQSGVANACWLIQDGTRCGFSTSNKRKMEMSKDGCVLRQLSVVASVLVGGGNVVSVVYDFGKDKERAHG